MILNADLFARFGLPRPTALSVRSELPPLVALRSPITNAARDAKELPKRIKVLNWGENETATKGTVKVGPNTVKYLAANQAAVGYDKIALDYGHNSLVGHPNYKPDPREVAAYGVPEVVEGDGLYVKDLQYTPSGEKHAREYIDLSPTPGLDGNGEVIFLHSTALCQQGEVKDLSFYSADFLLTKPFANVKALSATNHDMDYRKLLLTLLSLTAKESKKFAVKPLSAEASDQEIEQAVTALAGKLEAGNGQGDNLVDEEDVKALASTVKDLKGLVKQQGETLKALSATLERQERDAITADAISQGKLIPLSAKDLSLEQFSNLVKDLPAGQVPLDRRTPEAIQAFSAEVGAGSGGAAEAVRSQLGISRESWDKTK